jgi:hypothetical protein
LYGGVDIHETPYPKEIGMTGVSQLYRNPRTGKLFQFDEGRLIELEPVATETIEPVGTAVPAASNGTAPVAPPAAPAVQHRVLDAVVAPPTPRRTRKASATTVKVGHASKSRKRRRRVIASDAPKSRGHARSSTNTPKSPGRVAWGRHLQTVLQSKYTHEDRSAWSKRGAETRRRQREERARAAAEAVTMTPASPEGT